MSEAQEWRDSTKSIFESFGDMVVQVQVKIPKGAMVYDSSQGRMVPGLETTLKFPAVEFGNKNKLSNPDLWKERDKVLLAGTYDLAYRVPIGMKLTRTDPVTKVSETWDIIQVSSEDGGIGAAAYLHLRKAGG